MKNLETIEEASEKEFPLIDTEWCRTGAAEEENLQLLGHRKSFIKGATWQAERMYSKEVYEDALNMQKCSNAGYESRILELQEQIKNMYSEKEVIDILVEFSADIKKVWNITNWFEQHKKKS